MAIVIHIAEVAALLLVAYVVGWAIGYGVRRLTIKRPTVVDDAVAAARLAAVKGETPDAGALVQAPVIVPVDTSLPGSTPPEPAIAAEPAVTVEHDAITPIVARMAATPATPAPTLAPVAIAVLPVLDLLPVATTPVASLAVPPVPELIVEPGPLRDASPPAASEAPDAPAPALSSATPSHRPGEAWAGEIKGRAPTLHRTPPPLEPQPEGPTVEPLAEAMASEPAPVEPIVAAGPSEPAADLATAEPVAEVAPSEPALPEPAAPTPAPEPQPEPTPEPAATLEPVAPPPAPPTPVAESDEDAAMRAIEGGWSRRTPRASLGEPIPDVGAAVAAAQVAVEQALALSGIDHAAEAATAHAVFGKPVGLPTPREGGRDNLKEIDGVSPSDELALNRIGIFHFDQIAEWDHKEVLWLENHVFARGRITREAWLQQASGLADGKARSAARR